MRVFSVLFVCAANLCRSPTAHGIFRKLVADQGLGDFIRVQSAGTHNLYTDSPPDARSQSHAAQRGYEIADLRARHLQDADFEQADLILVMDWSNLGLVQQRCPEEHLGKVRRMMEFSQTAGATVVPDPYPGEPKDFELVLDMLEEACDGLMRYVRTAL